MYLNAHFKVCDVINHFTEDRSAWERKFPNPTDRRHTALAAVLQQYTTKVADLKQVEVTRSALLDVL